MEITVISEDENPMLHRTDVRFRVSHAEATPDRLAVRDSLAARLNKDANEVVVRRLDTKFGMRETVGEAKVYQAAEFAEDVEHDHMLARNKIGGHGEEAAEPEVEAEDEPEVEAEAEEEDEATEAEEADEEDEPEAEDAGEDDEPDDAEAEDEAAEADDDASEEDEAADADAGEEADDADEEAEE